MGLAIFGVQLWQSMVLQSSFNPLLPTNDTSLVHNLMQQIFNTIPFFPDQHRHYGEGTPELLLPNENGLPMARGSKGSGIQCGLHRDTDSSLSQNSCQMWIELVLSSESGGDETIIDSDSSHDISDAISEEEGNDAHPGGRTRHPRELPKQTQTP